MVETAGTPSATRDDIHLRLVLWSCTIFSNISVAIGDFTLGVHVPLIIIVGTLAAVGGRSLRASSLLLVITATFIVLIHTIYTINFGVCIDSVAKSTLSFALLSLLTLFLLPIIPTTIPTSINKDVRRILLILLISVALHYVYLGIAGAQDEIRASGIFREPSHLALTVSPLLASLAYSTNNGDRRFAWFTGILFFALSPSATYIAVVGICLLSCLLTSTTNRKFGRRALTTMVGITVAGAIVIFSPFREELSSRLMGLLSIDADSNLSSIIYVYGWEAAIGNFIESHGMGLGFNRMGCEPRITTNVDSIIEVFGIDGTNYNDGSFTFSKIVSELGFFGIAAWCIGLFLLFASTIDGSLARSRTHKPALAVGAVTVVLIGGLLRGTGYFSGSVVLCVYFLLYFTEQRMQRRL